MYRKCVLSAMLMSLVLFPGSSNAEDIFMWPDSVDETQVHACRKETRSLVELQKKSLLKNLIAEPSDMDKILDQFDLNGDGICELYMRDNHASGTGGYAEGIFQKKGDTYYLIANLFGFDLKLAEKKGGYVQLIYHHVVNGQGGETESPDLFRFDGKEYVRVKTPGWNRNKYNAKGIEKYKQKDYKTAELYFINALRVRTLSDKGYDIKNNLALSYIRTKDFDKAELILHKLLRDINNSGYAGDAAAAYYNLGLIYEIKNDLAKSLSYYKKSLNHSPSDIRRQKVKEIEDRFLRRIGKP